MNFKSFILIIFTYLISFGALAQQNLADYKLNRKVLKLSRSLNSDQMIFGRSTGGGGGSSYSYEAFQKIMMKATRNDLLKLSQNQDKIIRGYAFWGLVLKHKDFLSNNTHLFSDDSEMVTTFLHGCVPHPYNMNDFVKMLMELTEEEMKFYYLEKR